MSFGSFDGLIEAMGEESLRDNVQELLEKVSALVHEEWMDWAKNILESEDISDERVTRWKEECFKPYEELTEEMKEFDREWGMKFLRLLQPDAADMLEAEVPEED